MNFSDACVRAGVYHVSIPRLYNIYKTYNRVCTIWLLRYISFPTSQKGISNQAHHFFTWHAAKSLADGPFSDWAAASAEEHIKYLISDLKLGSSVITVVVLLQMQFNSCFRVNAVLKRFQPFQEP